jgi:gamma-tubulin complex component 3
MERMKWLAIVIDAVSLLKGGAVCSALHSYVLNGSPSTRVFISRILKEVCSPILLMMRQWMLEGELNDPFGEFFVEDTTRSLPPGQAQDDRFLWADRYRLNHVMIPNGLLSYELAHKILLTGKAVNFIRRCCGEHDWIVAGDEELLNGMAAFDVNALMGGASDG